MKRLKKIVSLILCLLMVFLPAVNVFAAEFDQHLWTSTYLVLDLTTGDVLLSNEEDEVRYPASLTKMMTAILAYEYYIKQGYGLNSTVVADEEAADVEPTKFGLKYGEEMTVDEAINIMLLMSANDIAIMLAKGVGGTTENFARLMNLKAQELGCKNTHFVTPNGLHDDEHYSTASDLAIIAEYLLDNEYLASVVAQDHYDYSATNRHSAGTVYSTNMLYNSETKLYVGNTLTEAKYSGGKVFGVKTGTTPEAGGCLITAVQRDDTKVLVVILNSRSDWTYLTERYADAHLLLDWSFNNYRTAPFYAKGSDYGIVKVKRGEFNKVNAVLAEDVIMTLPTDGSGDSSISYEYELAESITAPFEQGALLGTMTVYRNGEVFGQYDLVSEKEIVKGGILSIFGIEDAMAHKIFSITGKVLLVFLILVIALMIVRAINKRKARLRKKKKAQQRAEQEKRRAELKAALERKEPTLIQRDVEQKSTSYYIEKDDFR